MKLHSMQFNTITNLFIDNWSSVTLYNYCVVIIIIIIFNSILLKWGSYYEYSSRCFFLYHQVLE